MPVDFGFDGKYYRNAGYTIQHERVTKLPPGEEVTLTVSYTAKRTMKFGRSKTVVPVEVKNGARYELELIANITIPEIIMEGPLEGPDRVNFGKVLCGQR